MASKHSKDAIQTAQGFLNCVDMIGRVVNFVALLLGYIEVDKFVCKNHGQQ